jgi:hypothetical protein
MTTRGNRKTGILDASGESRILLDLLIKNINTGCLCGQAKLLLKLVSSMCSLPKFRVISKTALT